MIDLQSVAQTAAAGASIVLMGICGIRLLLRFVRVLRGQESADGLERGGCGAPGRELLAVFGIALASRLALFLLAYGMHRVFGAGEDGFFVSLKPLWVHWDTRHYLGIAQDGYVATGDERLRLVFFPLYPLLMRLLSPITGGDVFYSGTLISVVCGSAAAALVYDLAHMHFGRKTAALAAAYFLLSPLSVFLCCVYTEGLFILLTLAAVCLLRRGHPWPAALCGMGSAFTRMPGVIVAGLLIIAGIDRVINKKEGWRAAAACAGQVAVVFMGLIAYLAVNWVVTGDPFMYTVYQKENWFQEPGTFWASTANTVRYVFATYGEDDWLWTWVFQLICMFGIYALLAGFEHLLPFDLAAYSFVYAAVVLAPTWLLSGARYLYALCALPLLLARLPMRRWAHGAALAVSGALLILWVFGFTIAVTVL